MTRSRSMPMLPPRGIFVGTRLLFDPEIVQNLKITLLQLMALAWRSPDHTTPKLTYAILSDVLAKDERTIRGQLTLLRSYHAALRLRYAEPGQFYVVLADWLYRNDGPRGSDSDANLMESGIRLPLPDQEELKNQNQEEEEEEENSELLLLLPDHDQTVENSPRLGDEPLALGDGPAGIPAEDSGAGAEEEESINLPEDFRARLLEKGLFAQLLGEVARRAEESGYTADALNALLDWSIEDEERQPAALFMYRLRKAARPPAQYLNPCCPRCGQRGQHAPGCPRSYSADF